jgi:biopolymer transport protein ExbD
MARKRRKRGGGGLGSPAMPSLNSLMDVVTIILVYFVKTFAVSPLSVQEPSIQLPISTSLEAPEDLPVVMITGAERREVGPDGRMGVVKTVPTISVDDHVIMQLGENFVISPGELEGQFVIRRLKQELLEVKKKQNVTDKLMDKEGTGGKVIFVVDKYVPYRTLSAALVSASMAGFAEFKFAIVKNEG